jgi:hypothetical protein
MDLLMGRVNQFCAVAVAVACSTIAFCSHASADLGAGRRWFAQAEIHGSFLSDVADRSMIGVTFGPAAKAGYRWGDWGAFFSVENNAWVSADFGSKLQPGALNIGFGGELIWAKGFVRTSVAVGPSILLYDTALDEAGTTGLYADIRPTGLRWAMNEWLVLMVDPLAFTLVAPVLSDPALILVQYRTTFTTEFRW